MADWTIRWRLTFDVCALCGDLCTIVVLDDVPYVKAYVNTDTMRNTNKWFVAQCQINRLIFKFISERIFCNIYSSLWNYSIGKLNNFGLNSSNDFKTMVAALRWSSGTMSSGTITLCMPASTAARTPFGASSNTRQALGSGLSTNRFAATKNMSGAGFPSFTSGSVDPYTLWWNKSNSFWWLPIFNSAISWPELVAKQNGILLRCKLYIRRSAPFIKSSFLNSRRHIVCCLSRNCCIVIGKSRSLIMIFAVDCSVVPSTLIRVSNGYSLPNVCRISRHDDS